MFKAIWATCFSGFLQTKKVQAVTAFSFGQDGNQGKKAKETIDPKEQEAKQKKSQVIFNGQHAVSKLREAFDMLSNSLGLQVCYVIKFLGLQVCCVINFLGLQV